MLTVAPQLEAQLQGCCKQKMTAIHQSAITVIDFSVTGVLKQLISVHKFSFCGGFILFPF